MWRMRQGDAGPLSCGRNRAKIYDQSTPFETTYINHPARHRRLGPHSSITDREKYIMTQPELEDRIAVWLGGRAAELIKYSGIVSTGASDNLEKATELARQMVMRFGTSGRLGQLTYGHALASRFLRMPFIPEERNYSERTAEAIDDEIRSLMDRQYERVSHVPEEHRDQLKTIVDHLIRKETLERAELESLLAPDEVKPS
jgi:cell division protease FtsH